MATSIITPNQNIEHILNTSKTIPESPNDRELARLILGDDYITPDEMTTTCGFIYSNEQLAQLYNTRLTRDLLLWFHSTGTILIPRPPEELDFLQVRALDKNGWSAEDDQKFIRIEKVTDGGWIAIRKKAIQESYDKTWKEQQKLIRDDEYIPNVSEALYAVSIYNKVRGVLLFPNEYIRTRTTANDGDHVCIGYSNERGPRIVYIYKSDRRYFNHGITVFRKYN